MLGKAAHLHIVGHFDALYLRREGQFSDNLDCLLVPEHDLIRGPLRAVPATPQDKQISLVDHLSCRDPSVHIVVHHLLDPVVVSPTVLVNPVISKLSRREAKYLRVLYLGITDATLGGPATITNIVDLEAILCADYQAVPSLIESSVKKCICRLRLTIDHRRCSNVATGGVDLLLLRRR